MKSVTIHVILNKAKNLLRDGIEGLELFVESMDPIRFHRFIIRVSAQLTLDTVGRRLA
jgi:hypothetical protein